VTGRPGAETEETFCCFFARDVFNSRLDPQTRYRHQRFFRTPPRDSFREFRDGERVGPSRRGDATGLGAGSAARPPRCRRSATASAMRRRRRRRRPRRSARSSRSARRSAPRNARKPVSARRRAQRVIR
jgi:hypothetical protein